MDHNIIYTIIDELYEARSNLKSSIDRVEKLIGLDRIQYVDHVQGTDTLEFVCKGCNKTYYGSRKLACPNCYPSHDKIKLN